MWLVGVISGCGQWVWSMAVSIGGGFTGKLHHEVSIPLVCGIFLQPHSTSFFFMKNIFCSCSGTFL